MSAEESSLSAPFIDDAPHAQKTNLQNTTVSYYPKGELVAMVLDLLVRGRSNGKHSLDDVMRAMYEEFYLKSSSNSYYLHGRGYQPEDLLRVTSQVAGVDFAEFFKRYVQSPETLPYDEVVLATGSATNYYGNDALARRSLGLKDLGQALQLRNHVLECLERAAATSDSRERRRLLTFCIIGGGPTGVEYAGALAELVRLVLPHEYPEFPPSDVRITRTAPPTT